MQYHSDVGIFSMPRFVSTVYLNSTWREILQCVSKKPDRQHYYDIPSPIHNIY